MTKYTGKTKLQTTETNSNNSDRINDVKSTQEKFQDFIELEDIDQSICNWLINDLDISVIGENEKRIKVPIEFATQERWFKAQKEKGYRDKHGRIILPHIAVKRTSEDYEKYVPRSPETDITFSTTPSSERSSDYLNSRNLPLKDNKIVYDVYTIPQPIYVTINYEITAHTSYLTQMNEIQTQIMGGSNQFATQYVWIKFGNYKFRSIVGAPSDQSNIDDFSDTERILRKVFPITCNAYIISDIKNKPNQVKYYRTSTRFSWGEEVVDIMPQ